MAKFIITPETTVAELKQQFGNEVGCVLRVYEGRSEASDDATLVSLGAKEGELEFRLNRTVGKFEEAFRKDLNLKVKVYTRDNWVKVLDGITLAVAARLPNGMTKARMEEYLSYQRDENKPAASQCNNKMRKIDICLYGEGTRLDVFDSSDDLTECHNAMRDGVYFDITVKDGEKETKYSYDDLGRSISDYNWPDDIYDEDEEKFIDPCYAQFEGKTPGQVFEFGGCDLYDAEENFVDRIDMIQTKVSATVTIEIGDNEKFDPKKLHFMYSEFVVPEAELEINTGVVYDGRQYDIELEVDSEREISCETIWEDDAME